MPAKWLYLTVVVVFAVYASFEAFTDEGLAHRVNEVQMALLADHYYPSLTALVLTVPVLAIGYLAGLLLDFVTHKGVFKPAPVLGDDAKTLLAEMQTRPGARLSVLRVLGQEIWSVNDRHFRETTDRPGRWATAVKELQTAGLVAPDAGGGSMVLAAPPTLAIPDGRQGTTVSEETGSRAGEIRPAPAKPAGRWFMSLSLKTLLFVVFAPFASWMLIHRGREEMARPPESAPTAISAEHFARDYRGQGWLAVDGVWAARQAWVSPTPTSKYNDRTNVFVPIVPADWTAADPVHVIAVIAAPDGSAARTWPAEHADDAQGSVTGSVAPKGVWDYRRMFPDLAVTEPIVFVYEGQRPATPGDGRFDIGFGLAIAAFAALLVLAAYRRSRREGRGPG